MKSVTALILATGLLMGAAQAEDLPSPQSLSIKGKRLNELALWDLDNDHNYELFYTTADGTIAACQVSTLKQIWKQESPAESLTAPIIGDFLGKGVPILATCSSKGKVTFRWPASGEIITTLETGKSVTVAPSTAPLPDPAKDLFVFTDDVGQIIVIELQPDGKATERLVIPATTPSSETFRLVGKSNYPPVCADLNSDGTPEIVTCSSLGVLQVATLTQPPIRAFTRLAEQSQPTTPLSVGPIAGADQPHAIIFGVNANIHAFQWTLTGATATITSLLQAPAFGSVTSQIILAPMNDDNIPDVISTSEKVISARYLSAGSDGARMLLDIFPQPLSTISPPLSQAIPFSQGNKAPAILSIDDKGDLLKWTPGEATPITTLLTGPKGTAFTPAGPFIEGKPTLINWNQNDEKLYVSLLSNTPAPESAPVLTAGILYNRSGLWNPTPESLNTLQSRAAAALKEASDRASAAPADTESPLDDISLIRGISLKDPLAIKFALAGNSASWLGLALGLLLGIIILTAVALIFTRLRNR